MANGTYGRILHINLTQRSQRVQETGPELVADCLGGKGLAARLLLGHNPPGVDPLSPDNLLIFTAGPVTGSKVWGSCRYGVFTKSPQTGFFSESYSGGTVAERIMATGFDAVVIRGAADGLVWLEVGEDGVRFHDAGELRGLDTYRTDDRVKELVRELSPDSGKCGVACIGPAGENRVVFSVIENDYWRSAGRTGTGAVMGSKGIKAIAFHGRKAKEFAHPDLLTDFARAMAQTARTNAGVAAYKRLGTSMMVDLLNEAGAFPSRYWNRGRSPHVDRINAVALHERCEVKPNACLKCFMACGRLATVKQGRHQGLTVEGPEYETIYAFGGLCEVDSIEEIIFLNDLCDRLGMDTITAGNLAGLAIEAARQKRIPRAIDYGDVDAIAELLEDIAARRGMGELLAQGIRAAAAEWGMEDQAVHVKGLEPAGYDPRALKGMGLAYGTSPRGACHLRTTFYKPELSGMVPPDTVEGKTGLFTDWEDRLILMDTLILCRFYRDLYQWEQLGVMIRGVTGLDLDTAAMRALASDVADATRLFNLREGLTAEDDMLPVRLTSQPLPETGRAITRDDMRAMLRDYYQARNWDASGVPK